MNTITKSIRELEVQRDQIDTAIRTLRSLNGTDAQGAKRTYHMSAEGRARVAAAARKRWAKFHAQKRSA